MTDVSYLRFYIFLVLIVLVFGLIIVLKIVGTVRRVGRRMKGTDKSSSSDYAYTGQQQSEDASSSAASARKKYSPTMKENMSILKK